MAGLQRMRLATQPLDKLTGRVTYSQQILTEGGLIRTPALRTVGAGG